MTDMEHGGPSLALFPDLYELTMAQACWQSGTTAPAAFSLFFRKYPPERAYFVGAGLADVLDYLENLRFTPAVLDYLRSLERFDAGFLRYLTALRFTGSGRAMPEGELHFVNEAMLEVTAPGCAAVYSVRPPKAGALPRLDSIHGRSRPTDAAQVPAATTERATARASGTRRTRYWAAVSEKRAFDSMKLALAPTAPHGITN